MKGRGDKSKGFAYVEFNSVEPVADALKLDRTAIEGRPMYVSPSTKKRAENKPKLKVCCYNELWLSRELNIAISE